MIIKLTFVTIWLHLKFRVLPWWYIPMPDWVIDLPTCNKIYEYCANYVNTKKEYLIRQFECLSNSSTLLLSYYTACLLLLCIYCLWYMYNIKLLYKCSWGILQVVDSDCLAFSVQIWPSQQVRYLWSQVSLMATKENV